MMKKFLMVALFALMGATVLKAQNNGVKFIEDKPLSDVLAQAGKANKYAFVDVYATWCGPCKYMTSQVFPQAAAGDYFNKTFVNAKYDAEKGEGVTVAKTYRVTAYPTFLILNSKGEEVGRLPWRGQDTGRFYRPGQSGTRKYREVNGIPLSRRS